MAPGSYRPRTPTNNSDDDRELPDLWDLTEPLVWAPTPQVHPSMWSGGEQLRDGPFPDTYVLDGRIISLRRPQVNGDTLPPMAYPTRPAVMRYPDDNIIFWNYTTRTEDSHPQWN